MSALPYMPLYVADYLADAAHLTTLEHGAYLLLIMTYWQRGKPLPADNVKLARIARVSEGEWAEIWPNISEFFSEEDGSWHHKRIDAELAKVADKSDKARAAGKASAAKKAPPANQPPPVQQTFNERSTPVEQTVNHTDTDTDRRVGLDARAREVEDVIDLERRLREAAGWENEPSPGLMLIGEIQALIAAGASLERDVLPVLRAWSPKVRRPSSWRYFVPIIRETMEARIAAATGPPPGFRVGTVDNLPRNGHGTHQQSSSRRRTQQRLEAAVAEAERRENAGGG